MPSRVLADCQICPYKDRKIFLVGPRQFSAELLGSYIGSNTPAQWEIVERLQDIPVPDTSVNSPWHLIFVDCHDLDDPDLLNLIRSGAAPYLKHDIIALFHLKKDSGILLELLELGVRGFFFENDRADILLKGICALKGGELWASRDVMMQYIYKRPSPTAQQAQDSQGLTRREKEILLMVAAGHSNETIAAQLFISSNTVRTHIYNIFRKIGVQSRLQAALWSAKNL